MGGSGGLDSLKLYVFTWWMLSPSYYSWHKCLSFIVVIAYLPPFHVIFIVNKELFLFNNETLGLALATQLFTVASWKMCTFLFGYLQSTINICLPLHANHPHALPHLPFLWHYLKVRITVQKAYRCVLSRFDNSMSIIQRLGVGQSWKPRLNDFHQHREI